MKEQMIPVLYDKKTVESTQYANAMQGIRSAAARYGQHLHLIDAEEIDDTDLSALPDVCIIVSISMPFIERTLSLMRRYRRYAVLTGIDSEQFGSDVSCATPSRRAETQQLVNYLYKCGREKIALVGFGKNSINDNMRYHAALTAAAVWGNMLTEKDVFQWEHDPQESFNAFLEKCDRYDAVICPNDVISVCLINVCRKHGIRVPDNIYLASFGNMNLSSYYSPTITSVTMDMFSVGEQTYNVWRFLTMGDRQMHSSVKITVPSRILARESTANIEPNMESDTLSPALRADHFYYNPVISVLVGLDNCISQRDELDMRVIKSMLDHENYETICEKYYISSSTLRYRLNKIFADAGVQNRKQFEQLIHTHLGEGNPFAYMGAETKHG